MPHPPIYMDHHATTPVDSRVLEAMLPYFTERFGNAASRDHLFGRRAGEAVERGRRQIAALLDASPKEIVFTSGATESDNLALRGVAAAYRHKGDQIITVVTEHRAVLDTCRRLEAQGFTIAWLPVGSDGLVDPAEVERAITDRTLLVSIMAANNEIGVLQPLDEIGQITRRRGVLLHTDAAQAAGKIPLSVRRLAVDLVSLSAHKMHGPQGVGALYVRSRNPRVHLSPIIDGGGHEHGYRSGTLNLPGIVGFGAAAELAQSAMRAEAERLRQLRDRLLSGLRQRVGGMRVNGSLTHRLPNNLNVSFEGLDDETLAAQLEDVAVSSGAACTSESIAPSHVLKAIDVPDDLARATIRFGLGRFNTPEEVDYAVERVAAVVERLRQRHPAC
jgi:cysteine desulfurase